MKRFAFCLMLLFTSNLKTEENFLTLKEVVDYALKNNPQISILNRDLSIENLNILQAKSNKFPNLNLQSNLYRFKYASPITPISATPIGIVFPDFDKEIFETGIQFQIPLYKGGNLNLNVSLSELKKDISEIKLNMGKEDLIFNIISCYLKILQMEELKKVTEAYVLQMDAHKKKVEDFYNAGVAPKIDLIKAEVELSNSKYEDLILKNNLKNSYEVLKVLMGMENFYENIKISPEVNIQEEDLNLEISIDYALNKRLDYQNLLKKINYMEEKIRFEKGKALPIVSLSSEYFLRTGSEFDFEDNWFFALRFYFPLFDGGFLKREILKGQEELKKLKEEERALRLKIYYEIKEAILNIESSKERLKVQEKAVEEAKENLKLEILKYDTGEGTTTDVIDAQAKLLREEANYWQSYYDYKLSLFAFKKAIGKKIEEELINLEER